ncbi:MAG: hypothetical protein HQL22_06415 [Candidatus Omnitrophica bacterium]|nr:hypothetical protein [Candidatus Omnitrophota bacterium]
MDFEIAMSPDQAYMIICVYAKHAPDVLRSYLRAALAHPQWRSGMNILADLRRINLSDLSFDEIRGNSEVIKNEARKFGSGRCAVLISDAAGGFLRVSFWLAECYEFLSYEFKTFSSEPEARDWICQGSRDEDLRRRE